MKPLRILALILAVSVVGAVSASAGDDCCAKSATAAAKGSCLHGTASASADHCTRATGKSAGTGATRGGAMVAGVGACGMGAAARADCAGHADCSICSGETAWNDELRASGAHAQVVALRNGAMVVYTADTAEGVRALQAMLARHNEHVMSALAAGSDASLCGECKPFRGAMASGKFSREIVNVKNGCQVLLTSNDRAIVERIHGMTGAVAARTRS
jgi:hypothetical protein